MTLTELLNPVKFTDTELSIIHNMDPVRALYCEYKVNGMSDQEAYRLAKNDVDITEGSARKQAWTWNKAEDIILYTAYLKSVNREVYGNEFNEIFQHMSNIALGNKQTVITRQEIDRDGDVKTVIERQDDARLQLDACKTILGYAGITVQQSTSTVGTPQITLVDDL